MRLGSVPELAERVPTGHMVSQLDVGGSIAILTTDLIFPSSSTISPASMSAIIRELTDSVI